MGSKTNQRQKRFEKYVGKLAAAVGHKDREQPLKEYCTGLLLNGDRKSMEPMAALIHPTDTSRTHQRIQHFVSKAPWDAHAVLEVARTEALTSMSRHGEIKSWIVDDTGIPAFETVEVQIKDE